MKEKMKEHDISFKKESSMLCWRRILNTPWDQGQVWRVGGEWVTGQQGKMWLVLATLISKQDQAAFWDKNKEVDNIMQAELSVSSG